LSEKCRGKSSCDGFFVLSEHVVVMVSLFLAGFFVLSAKCRCDGFFVLSEKCRCGGFFVEVEGTEKYMEKFGKKNYTIHTHNKT